jgi:hypothetical protein
MHLRNQCAMNRLRTELSQIALFLQLAPQRQDQILGVTVGPMDLARDRWPIMPVDSIQPLTSGAGNPALYSVQRHTGTPRDRAKRNAPAHHRNDLPPCLREGVFLRMAQVSTDRRTERRRPVEAAGPVDAQNAPTRSLENAQNAFSTATTGLNLLYLSGRNDRKALSLG